MGGRIINNGSISAHVPRPNSIAYTTAKHAVTGLTKSTSLDGRKYDISCGQIDVGNALTEMTQRMTRGVPQPNGEIMIEPTMDVENVARAVVFMATVTPEANVQIHHRDGDQDAVCRPRLMADPYRLLPACGGGGSGRGGIPSRASGGRVRVGVIPPPRRARFRASGAAGGATPGRAPDR